jgi:hypothetical protein
VSKDRPTADLSSISLGNPSRGRASVVLSDIKTKKIAPADAVFFNKGWATAAGFRQPVRAADAAAKPRGASEAHESQLRRLLKHVAPNTAKTR